MSKQACDLTELVALMEDDRTSDNYELTTKHLADCHYCQRELERMAADSWWWSEGRDLIASSDLAPKAPTSSSVIAVRTSAESEACHLPKAWSIDFLEPASHPELLGQLGKYQIERVVGRGGMGIVLKGFDTELNRPVAIKVLAPHLASSGAARQRFAREAKAAAAVVHDHVVAIYGIESTGELPYLVMPFVGGESLQKYVDHNGPLEAIDITRITLQIASGLSAAHEQGLVHRDVKPANVMLESGFGRVLITDFGLARAADDASITRSGLVAGTPHYMSPEQANGEPVDQRSDLFSLGSVVYFMATGRTPFRGEGTMAVLHAICHKRARSVREVNANVPEPIEIIIRRLQEKQPHDRFASASSLRELLADYLAHLQDPTANRLPDALTHASPTKFRRLAMSAAVVCTVMLGSVFAFWPRTESSPDGRQPNEVTQAQLATSSSDSDDADEVSLFDEEVRHFAAAIEAVEAQWRSDMATSVADDAWEPSYGTLKRDIDRLEQEWTVRPAN